MRVPTSHGFPAGFVCLDTPGLGTLITEHIEVTLGELPFVDAAVICVDLRKGGLSRDVTKFLTSPGVRHLQHRFLIALTFADKRSATERLEVSAKAAGTLSHALGCSESEAAGRIVVVSAGPQATERDVSALRAAVQEVFEHRRESLMAERQLRISRRWSRMRSRSSITFARACWSRMKTSHRARRRRTRTALGWSENWAASGTGLHNLKRRCGRISRLRAIASAPALRR